MHRNDEIVHSSPSSETFRLPHHYFIWINWIWIRILEGKKPCSELDVSLHKNEDVPSLQVVSVKRWRKRSDSNPSKSVCRHSPASQMEHKMSITWLGNAKCSMTVLRRILTEVTHCETSSHGAGCGWNVHWTDTSGNFGWQPGYTFASVCSQDRQEGLRWVKPCLV